VLVPMTKVEIIGPKNLFFDVVSMIHEHGRLHIEDLTSKIEAGEVPLECMELHQRQQADLERMEELLIRVRAILQAMNKGEVRIDDAEKCKEYEQLYALDAEQLAREIEKVVEEVEEKTASLAAQHASLESEMALLARYEPILQKIQPLAKQIVTTGAYASVALLVERRYKSALEQLNTELDKITHKQCEIVSTDIDEDTTAAIIVFNKVYSDPVHKFLAVENVNQIRLPSTFEDMPFDIAYEELTSRRRSLPDELKMVVAELERMSLLWETRLVAIRDVLADRIAELGAIPKFGRTEYAFVVGGWIPEKEFDELDREIRQRWGNEIIVTKIDIREDMFAETPVAVQNTRLVAPFGLLANVRGVPKYGTLDPTWLLFIFFPLLYGMIVGDFGYGAIILAVVVWLRFKFREVELIQVATTILGPAATMVIVFGFMYGEGFGDMPLRAGWVAKDYATGVYEWFGVIPIFHRVDEIVPYMIIAIAVGVIHILFGITLGIINAIKTKHKKHAYERGGILTMILAILAIVGIGQLAIVPETIGETGQMVTQFVIAAIAIGGLVYAIKGGGVMGVIETLETVAHMASYIRIMAVGLAGALFADAINHMMTVMGHPIIGILMGVILHGVHVVIAAFSPLIHALRLNLLEFFGKFYETGKQPYSPFTKTGGGKSA